jgi:hypothetical protein
VGSSAFFSWPNITNWLKAPLSSSLSQLVPACAGDMLNQMLWSSVARPWCWATSLSTSEAWRLFSVVASR